MPPPRHGAPTDRSPTGRSGASSPALVTTGSCVTSVNAVWHVAVAVGEIRGVGARVRNGVAQALLLSPGDARVPLSAALVCVPPRRKKAPRTSLIPLSQAFACVSAWPVGRPGGATASRLVLGQREVVLLFLQEVQPQQRIEPVQTSQQVIDLVGLYSVARLGERDMCADPIGQPLDFGVGSAHRGGGFTAAERTGQRGVELGLLGSLVGQKSAR